MNNLLSRRVVLLLSACVLAGCGSQGDRPDLGQVSGTVTLDDKPLPGVVIVFKPETGRAATGKTDESGYYELQYLYDAPGCKIGPNKVSFEWEIGASGPALPAKYTSKSELTEDVKEGKNTIDFKLQSK